MSEKESAEHRRRGYRALGVIKKEVVLGKERYGVQETATHPALS